MNIAVTTQDEILRVCRELVAKEGIHALNMRRVAEACNVALGSLYNYFGAKDELITAVIDSVWRDIFHVSGEENLTRSFIDQVKYLFDCAREGESSYPSFFGAHMLQFASGAPKSVARVTMGKCFDEMKSGLMACLASDELIRPDAFSDTFSERVFVDFVFSAFLFTLLQRKSDEPLLEVIRRSVYR